MHLHFDLVEHPRMHDDDIRQCRSRRPTMHDARFAVICGVPIHRLADQNRHYYRRSSLSVSLVYTVLPQLELGVSTELNPRSCMCQVG
jgi:hypothetical protein